MKDTSDDEPTRTNSGSEPKPDHLDLLHVTKVLLLQNPEHVTALSCRRKLIKRLIDTDPTLRNKELSDELDVTSLILSVPSHAKSAALWSHRRWCLCEKYPSSEGLAAARSPTLSPHRLHPYLPEDVMDAELAFVLKCSDIYPRNYFAWHHRRWLLDGLVACSGQHLASAIAKERSTLAQFWARHPRDHSCTHHIAFLVGLGKRGTTESPAEAQETAVFSDAECSMMRTYTDLETTWLLMSDVLLSGLGENRQVAHMVQEMARKVMEWFDAEHRPPGSSAPLKDADPRTSSRVTLASHEHQAASRSLGLGLRTFYSLACRLGWISWSPETTRTLLELTKTCPIATETASPSFLQTLRDLIERFSEYERGSCSISFQELL